MINERYVLDASVAAKWFLNDEDVVDIAEMFLIRFLAKEIVFYAPHILEYELGHIITRAQRSGSQRIETDQAIEAYRTFSELPIVFCDLSVQDRQTILRSALIADFMMRLISFWQIKRERPASKMPGRFCELRKSQAEVTSPNLRSFFRFSRPIRDDSSLI